MHEYLNPASIETIPSHISQVPRSLQKYLRIVWNNGLIKSVDPDIQDLDNDLLSMYEEMVQEEQIESIIMMFTPQSFIRPDLYIPLIIAGYQDGTLSDGLTLFDTQIRGNIVEASLKRKAELETMQAHFSLGISPLNELEPEDTRIALQLLTTHVAALHNVNVELLP